MRVAWALVVFGLFVALLVGSWVSNLPSIRYLERQPQLLLVDSERAYGASGVREMGELGRIPDADGVLGLRALAGQPVVRWQLLLPDGADRVRVAARLDVDGILAEGSADPLVVFVLRQWDSTRYDSYLLAGLPAVKEGAIVDRVARIWRPELPFVLELRLGPEGGGLRLHDLRVEAMALRDGVEGIQGLLLVAWLILVLFVWAWLSRPASRRGRTVLWGVLVLLLAGMLAPGELVEWAGAGASRWLALLGDRGGPGNVAVLAHFVSFGALALVLLRVRGDLGKLWLLGILGCIAVATEFMQMLVENRHADVADVLVNLAGIATATLMFWIWRQRRRASVGERSG